MYTIVMDKYKNLNTTVRTTLFQQESMVDKIQFLVPPKYGDVELKDYTVTLKYVDPNGNFHSEALVLDEEMYKDYLRYELPVTTKLTQVSGTITLRLTLIKFEGGVTVEPTAQANGGSHTVEGTTMVVTDDEPTPPTPDPTTTIIDKLESNSTTLLINKPDGFTDYVNFEDLEAFKAQLAQMNRDLAKMPNDLAIGERENLHLVHDGEKIGEGVEILMPTQVDEGDSSKDGIFDLDDIKPDPEPQSNFIEV